MLFIMYYRLNVYLNFTPTDNTLKFIQKEIDFNHNVNIKYKLLLIRYSIVTSLNKHIIIFICIYIMYNFLIVLCKFLCQLF